MLNLEKKLHFSKWSLPPILHLESSRQRTAVCRGDDSYMKEIGKSTRFRRVDKWENPINDQNIREFPSPLRRSVRCASEWVSGSLLSNCMIVHLAETSASRRMEGRATGDGIFCPLHSAPEEPAGLFHREFYFANTKSDERYFCE